MNARLIEAGFSFDHPPVITEADVEALLEIERQAFPIDFYTREQLLEEFNEDPNLFILARNSRKLPVGYISGSLKEGIGCIVSVAVDEALRGQGIGSCLIRLMMDYLGDSGATSLRLHTREDNPATIRLFQNFGFVTSEREKDYYKDHAPALVMRKRVK